MDDNSCGYRNGQKALPVKEKIRGASVKAAIIGNLGMAAFSGSRNTDAIGGLAPAGIRIRR